jgi:hypothetical protein
MSASSYKPATTMTAREIAIPAVPSLRLNQYLPSGVAVERFPSGQAGSANTAGGYVSPAAFEQGQPKG